MLMAALVSSMEQKSQKIPLDDLGFAAQNFKPGQNIWHNIERYNKTGQDFKNIISNFAYFLYTQIFLIFPNFLRS